MMECLSRIPFAICTSLLLFGYFENASIIFSYQAIVAQHHLRAAVLAVIFHVIWLCSISCLFICYFRGPGFVEGRMQAEEKSIEHAIRMESAAPSSIERVSAARSRSYSSTMSSSVSATSYEDEDDQSVLDSDDEPLDRLAAKASPYVGLLPHDQQREMMHEATESFMMKADGSARHCRKCNQPKPDRAHHCSVCKSCVLKMDHHCGVIGCCVGYKNYKAFLLFLIYTTLFCIFSLYNSVTTLIDFVNVVPDGFELSPIGWAVLMMLSGAIGLVLGGFTGFHLYLVSQNKTTIENIESTRIRIHPSQDQNEVYHLTAEQRRQLRKASARYHIYNIGWRENLRQVFASRYGFFGIFLPIDVPPLKKASTFPINERHLEKIREIRSRT